MRNHFLIGIVVAGLAGEPVPAADLVPEPPVTASQSAAFAGARVRISLGGRDQERQLRAGLVLAPTLRTEGNDRRPVLRFAEGIELGARQDGPIALSIAGRPVTGPAARQLSGPRAGVSTVGWIAIGSSVVLVAGALLFVDAMNDASE